MATKKTKSKTEPAEKAKAPRRPGFYRRGVKLQESDGSKVRRFMIIITEDLYAKMVVAAKTRGVSGALFVNEALTKAVATKAKAK